MLVSYGVIVEILEYIADGFNFLCEKVTVNPEKPKKRITRTVAFLAVAESLAKVIRSDFVLLELRFLQRWWAAVCLFIIGLAVLPPILAYFDKNKAGESVRKGYISKNFGCNLAGAVAAVVLLLIAHYEIKDFRFLEEYHIDSIIKIILPICLWIALSYQSIEQQIGIKNHDPSLKWKNQICNMLHLFNIYFWVFFSTILIIAYTIYCYIHNVQLVMNIWYLIFLSLVLIFFYLCACNEEEHIRFVFLVDVPVILICSIYWMTWFETDTDMVLAQFVFVLLHSLLYTFIVYIQNGVIARNEPGSVRDPAYKVCFKKIPFKVKSWFHIITFLLVIVAYCVFWVVPNSITAERVESVMARACIGKICRDTNQDANLLMDEIESFTWYDEAQQDMDRSQFLIYLYDQLFAEMVDKGVIPENATALSYEELIEWSAKTP